MPPESAELLVADSFRVRLDPATGEAGVRGLDRHLFRFSRSVRQATGRTLDGIGAFLDEARGRIAEYGEGWPRLELLRDGASGEHRLGLRLRPLPGLGDAIELRSARAVALVHPERKGPNLGALAELNSELGAEALLLDWQGCAIEGATTSLVWWRDDRLQRTPGGGRVPSVTESLLANIAKGRGIAIDRTSVTPAELAVDEVWAVNALHGIRRVTSLDGASMPSPDAARLRWFREALDETWEPVRPGAPRTVTAHD